MRATARSLRGRLMPEVEVGSSRLATHPPRSEEGVEDTPTPQELLAASLAACSTMTMKTYAERKGWDIGERRVEVDYEPAQRGSPARCALMICLPEHVPEEQRVRLISMAAKSPVGRTLEGEIMFDEQLILTAAEPAPAGENPPPPLPRSNGFRRRLPRSSRAA